jgi:hypothetical protein
VQGLLNTRFGEQNILKQILGFSLYQVASKPLTPTRNARPIYEDSYGAAP